MSDAYHARRGGYVDDDRPTATRAAIPAEPEPSELEPSVPEGFVSMPAGSTLPTSAPVTAAPAMSPEPTSPEPTSPEPTSTAQTGVVEPDAASSVPARGASAPVTPAGPATKAAPASPPPTWSAPAHAVTPLPIAQANPLVAGSHTTFFGVLRSEWIKLWSLPSTWWVIGVAVVVSVGLGAIMGGGMRVMRDTPAAAQSAGVAGMTFHASDVAGVATLTQMILCILAILFIANEYSSGQIRATLTAAPGRLSTLAAKTVVVVVVTGVVTFVATYGAVLVGWLFMSGFAVDDRFTWSGIKIVLGLTLATVLVSVFALAVGFIVRNSAAGIGIVVALLFVLPIVLSFMSWHWVATMHQYLIDQCQTGLFTRSGGVPASGGASSGGSASSGFGFVKSLWVTGLWAVVPLAIAGLLLKRRDA